MRAMCWLVVMLCGCGPVIGDACTVDGQCGPGVCLNGPAFPGGACSLGCSEALSCPAGSTCVEGVLSSELSGCLYSCVSDSNCRQGYTCQTWRGSSTKVCIN